MDRFRGFSTTIYPPKPRLTYSAVNNKKAAFRRIKINFQFFNRLKRSSISEAAPLFLPALSGFHRQYRYRPDVQRPYYPNKTSPNSFYSRSVTPASRFVFS